GRAGVRLHRFAVPAADSSGADGADGAESRWAAGCAAVPGERGVQLRVAEPDVASAPRGVLLFLTGGPGEPGVPFVSRLVARLGPALRGYRLVMFDQRGTGAGALDCPALQRQMGASDLTVPAPVAVRSCAA